MKDRSALGKVKIDHEVLASISAAAAGRVKGVTRIIPGFVGLVESFFNRSATRHSVRVRTGEGRVSVELVVEVVYGSDIPQLAWEVQKAVKDAVEKMSGMKVDGVDVEVRALSIPREER